MEDGIKSKDFRASLDDEKLKPYRLIAFNCTSDAGFSDKGRMFMFANVLYADGQITLECLNSIGEELKAEARVIRSKTTHELKKLDGDPMDRVIKGASFFKLRKFNTPLPSFYTIMEAECEKVLKRNAMFLKRREKAQQRSEEKIRQQEQKEMARYGGAKEFTYKEENHREAVVETKKKVVEEVPVGIVNLTAVLEKYDEVDRQEADERRRAIDGVKRKPLSIEAINKKLAKHGLDYESAKVLMTLANGQSYDPRKEQEVFKPSKMEVDDVMPEDFSLPGFEVNDDDLHLVEELRAKNTLKKEEARKKRAAKRAAKKEAEADSRRPDAVAAVQSKPAIQQPFMDAFLRSIVLS